MSASKKEKILLKVKGRLQLDGDRYIRHLYYLYGPLRLTFEFDSAQDIVEINIAFYKGDERTRAFKVKTWDTSGDKITTEFTSGGETDGFEAFSLGSDETTKLAIFPASPNEDDWLSISEVGHSAR